MNDNPNGIFRTIWLWITRSDEEQDTLNEFKVTL